MRVSKKGEYALRAMIHLAENYKKGAVRIRDISKKEKIPEKFLEQILLSLRKAGLLQSRRGVGGGYALSKRPGDITLARVIRIIDGPLAPLGCTSTWAHVSCPDEGHCGLHRVMMVVRNAIAGILEGVTFADLCDGGAFAGGGKRRQVKKGVDADRRRARIGVRRRA
jgi:Rrf2 family protein